VSSRDDSVESSEAWTSLSADVAAKSHQGHIRENNEDHYLVIRFGRSLETVETNLDLALRRKTYELTGYGMFVADGIGGMAGGEVASSLALAKLVELLADTPDWILAFSRWQDLEKVLKRMTRRFVQIDQALKRHAQQNQSVQGLGTTLTVAGIVGNDLVIGHIGDSRAYLMSDGSFTQLTNDHTLAQALIDAGIASQEDPASLSMRHVLTAALGSLMPTIEPQVYRLRLQAGDRLLLCTDGLTDMVPDPIIASVLRESKSARSVCQNLVDLALSKGGRDNITVVVAFFGPPLQDVSSPGKTM
jgi:PPM family protein phosphatase